MLIGLGGGLGALARYQVGKMIGKYGNFPLATFLINIVGSFMLGFLSGELDNLWHQFICIGFLGGFTTFSTFGYETTLLLVNRNYVLSILYIVSSVIVSIIMCYIGYQL